MSTLKDMPLIDQIAYTLDGLAFRRYKEGECLPRGHECSTAAKVNEIQGFRQRSAESKARKIMKLIEESRYGKIESVLVALLIAAEKHDKADEEVVNACDDPTWRLEEFEDTAKTAWEHYELAKDAARRLLVPPTP